MRFDNDETPEIEGPNEKETDNETIDSFEKDDEEITDAEDIITDDEGNFLEQEGDIPDLRNCPIEKDGFGHWEGERGQSMWIPEDEYVPPDKNGRNNPDEKSWGQLKDDYDIEGIPFNDGEPDFSEVSVGEPITIDEFSDDRAKNFEKADEQYYQENKDQFESADDVESYRDENNLTWHEHRDCKTMEMVPREIHDNVSHRGGVSKIKEES